LYEFGRSFGLDDLSGKKVSQWVYVGYQDRGDYFSHADSTRVTVDGNKIKDTQKV